MNKKYFKKQKKSFYQLSIHAKCEKLTHASIKNREYNKEQLYIVLPFRS
jgi:hypothetical protein